MPVPVGNAKVSSQSELWTNRPQNDIPFSRYLLEQAINNTNRCKGSHWKDCPKYKIKILSLGYNYKPNSKGVLFVVRYHYPYNTKVEGLI